MSLALAAASCADSAAIECRHVAAVQALVGGTTHSHYVYLSAAEEAALLALSFPGQDGWCSGTLVAPQAVLTAAHCLDAVAADAQGEHQVALGSRSASLGTFRASVRRHEGFDVALLLLESAPLGEAIVPLELDGTARGLGELMQVQGYGYDEQGHLGRLRFAVAPILSLNATTLSLGPSTLCAGDSGAAALTRAANGLVVVSGVLTAGSASCQGSDEFVLGSALKGWVESIVGPARPVGPDARLDGICGELGSRGRCYGDAAVWCAGSGPTGQACDAASPCGWSVAEQGYRCVASGDDPCAGESDLGSCADGVASRCIDGVRQQSPCDACGAACTRDPLRGTARCSSSAR